MNGFLDDVGNWGSDAWDWMSETASNLWPFGKPSEAEMAEIVGRFPEVFEQAVADWAKFKLGVQQGLFSSQQRQEVIDWYETLLDVWEAIRPNWTEPDVVTGMVSTHKVAFAEHVDRWLSQWKTERQISLGVVPLIVIGIFVVAGIAGAGILVYALSHYKEQSNLTAMIEAETAGKLAPGTVKEAVQQEKEEAGFFDKLEEQFNDIIKYALIGGVAVIFGPQIIELVQKITGKASKAISGIKE